MNARWVFSMVVQSCFHQLYLLMLQGFLHFVEITGICFFFLFFLGFGEASTGRVMAEVLWKVLTVGSFWWITPLNWKSCFGKGNSCDVRQFWGMLHWRYMFARWTGTCLFSSYVDLPSISELGSNCPFAFNCAKSDTSISYYGKSPCVEVPLFSPNILSRWKVNSL